ncbi:protein of unknown function [Candidatus Nitrosocosmicus franklandus]|uniref:Uncharacterized protein n=1 Tax=Candidatus Nitrosocosmicus franklandianus TaxID=1798806 RepID=A0A484IAZ5_9ARCH|nr:protein of unknown function [Candidatus Nitrosocosmicus franklandus]
MPFSKKILFIQKRDTEPTTDKDELSLNTVIATSLLSHSSFGNNIVLCFYT